MGKNLFVGNLPWTATNEDLLSLFQQQGAVAWVQVITDRDTGQPRGFGFVEMCTSAETLKAMEALHGTDFRGRALTVRQAHARPERGRSHRDSSARD